MKHVQPLLTILLIGLMLACEKVAVENTDLETTRQDFVIHRLETAYDFNSFSEQDQLKIAMAESLENALIADRAYAQSFLNTLVAGQKVNELVYATHKNVLLKNKSAKSDTSDMTLENILIQHVESSTQEKGTTAEKEHRIDLIRRADAILPNLVIKMPDWVAVILEAIAAENLEYAVYPGINTKDLSFQYKNSLHTSMQTLADYVPIQIKESETLLPVKMNTTTTLWGDDLIEDHFPVLQGCSAFNIATYVKFSTHGYDFIDKMRLHDDLMNRRLCTVAIDPVIDETNEDCDKEYERDCVREKNVIEGMKFVNYACLLAINNQPGGEDVFTLHYQFSVASMCGDLEATQVCPPNNWKLVFPGRFEDFFETKLHWGVPEDSENVSFIGKIFWYDYYVKSIPIYYDIPVDMSQEQIYSQARYLDLTPDSTWDGNEYGHAISMAVFEHDDVVVKESTTNTISITNTTKISNALKVGKAFETAANFSNSVRRTSSTTITIDAAKDVDLGKRGLNYYSKNYDLPNGGYGYYISTGAVSTHFAIYD